jgi:hypothetical protein
VPRPRRHVPGALLILLAPIYRRDHWRDAWVLRIVGNRLGPVLRPRGYRSVVYDEPTTGDDPHPVVTPHEHEPSPVTTHRPRE